MSSADEILPPLPDPAGSLDPPRRGPPTAVATMGAPLPEPVSGPVRWPVRRRSTLVQLVDRALDALDALGDGVRSVFTR